MEGSEDAKMVMGSRCVVVSNVVDSDGGGNSVGWNEAEGEGGG